MFPNDKVVEVVEVAGAESVKPYTDKGWVVLGVVTCRDLSEGYFIYSLGRLEAVD